MVVKLSDITEFIIDTKHNTPEFSAEGHPCIRTPNIGRGHFILDDVKRVDEKTYQVWTERAVPRTGDLILAREAPVGNVAWIPPNIKPCIGQRTVLIRALNSVDSRYLAYLLLGEECQNRMHSQSGGATVAHLNMSDIRALELPELPPLPVQRKIAAILSAYDGLIENNLRRIKILEEMAQNLYREWFVKFRFPGHQHTRFVDSPLGSIPEGWEVKRLDELCSAVVDGDWIETKDQGGEDYRLLQISNIGLGDFVETGKYRYVTQETFDRLNCTEIQTDDLLIARMPTPIGRGWLARKMPWRMITAVDVAIARPDKHSVNPVFLMHFWNQPSNLATIDKQSSGTTRLRITRRELCAITIPTPPTELQEYFSAKTRPMLDLCNSLRDKNSILRRTRDLLLPKLISGKVDVSELDIAVREELL
jgi:type I restriction enzyme S subunit